MKQNAQDDRKCMHCKWRSDEFSSVCVNGISPNRGDFVMPDDTCHEFERMDDNADHG